MVVAAAAAGVAAVSLLALRHADRKPISAVSLETQEPPARPVAAGSVTSSSDTIAQESAWPDASSATVSATSQALAAAPAATPRPIIIRTAAGNQSETLVIESPDPSQGAVEVVIRDRRMLPFALQGQANPDLPAPIRSVLDDIAGEFADSLLTAVEAADDQANSEIRGTSGQGPEGVVANPPSGGTNTSAGAGPAAPPATLPDETLRRARDIADQRYRAFFGDAAFNQAGLQRAIDYSTAQTADR